MKRIKRYWKSRFVRIWSALLVLVFIVLAVRMLGFDHASPSLEQVLSKNTGSKGSDFSLFIASLLAFSFATLSAAKGYELFKRNRAFCKGIMPEMALDIDEHKTMIVDLKRNLEELLSYNEELRSTKDWLEQENTGLKDRLSNLTCEIEEVKSAEQMLRKSNISLSKECERLKSDNEILMLRINSLLVEKEPEIKEPKEKENIRTTQSKNAEKKKEDKSKKIKSMAKKSPKKRKGKKK
jgi:hypothetical protein